ncbi:acyl-CoA dehydrogenase family protein [Rhodococcus fascians]|nr:acyl-CoA dehydrogenase family protein [Rhodococcus fascians]MBY4022467.1 acyl-CoA dehydrogenase family protein [Rhodococcus fascians]
MTILDTALGDPYDPDNEYAIGNVLEADERREITAGTVKLLSHHDFGAEFVPTALGGRFTSTEQLVHLMRPVFGRDASLGLGYGLTSFMAAVNVYAAGRDDQQRAVAGTLISGRPISVAYHEIDHGNDFGANELLATQGADNYLLNGTKNVINNADRARSAVVFARTGTSGSGGRAHSLFLVDLEGAQSPQPTPRHLSMALRGCRLSGLDFRDTPVAASDMVGAPGTAIETALTSFQVSRCVAAGAGLGPVDESLFAVMSFSARRRLYGRYLTDLPHVKSTLAAAFADLMAAECMVADSANTLHFRPAFGSAHSAAAKFIVPRILESTMSDLSVVLGARFYLRTGPYALFGKHFRDFPALAIGHAGGAACQLSILPQLKRLTTRGDAADAPTAGTTLSPLSFASLRIVAPGPDPVLNRLRATLESAPAHPALTEVWPILLQALTELRSASADLAPQNLGVSSSAAALQLTEQYSLLLVAAAVVDRLCGDAPSWAVLALYRTAERIVGRHLEPPQHVVLETFTDVLRRTSEGRAYDLRERPVPRTMP